jgi:glycolate oxidase iron-sulfur subunit
MHLVDQARVRVETQYRRPVIERMMRAVLALILPNPSLFRISMIAARLAKPLMVLLPVASGSANPSMFVRLRAMLALAPSRLPPAGPAGGQVFPAQGEKRSRVALLQGCAQKVLAPGINEAAIRFLTRHGVEVVLVAGEQCCGSLTHHMGRDHDALWRARANIDLWINEIDTNGLDAILVTTSGCGTTIKDYGYALREDRAMAAKASRVSALAKDITEFVGGLDIAWPQRRRDLVVAYHSACSLQHGQKIAELPKELLFKSGFVVKDVPESHLCCGSAGTYNILQPDIARKLRERKIANIASVKPDVVAAGNIGCMVQLSSVNSDRTQHPGTTQTSDGLSVPVVHTIELLDWATGGPRPALN